MEPARPADRDPAAAPRTVLRVDSATLVIFGVMLSPAPFVAALLLRDWLRGAPWAGTKHLRDAALLFGAYVAALYWMCGRTVELLPGRIVERVFFRRKVFDVSNVAAASVVSRPAPTLELRYRGARRAVPAFIVKPYSRAGVRAMLLHIRASSPGVELDRVAGDMSEGRFDSVTRQTVSALNLWRLALVAGGAVLAAALLRLLRG